MIIDMLQNRESFSFARYGDGEWAMILKKDPKFTKTVNIYGQGSVEAGELLKRIILSRPKYIIGIQPFAMRLYGDEILKLLHKNVITTNSDILHKMSEDGKLKIFIQLLEKRNVVLVGPDYLKNLPFKFHHVPTPIHSAWEHTKRLAEEILKFANTHSQTVILYSASMASKILIDNLYGHGFTQIDTGSVFDPYCGVNSRKYHKNVIGKFKLTY